MNRLHNWTFEDIVQFLKQQYFTHAGSFGGSHQYFSGFVDSEERLVEIQFHAGKSIKPKTLQLTVIPQSGIPQKCWLEYAQMPPKLRKKYCYKGCKPLPK